MLRDKIIEKSRSLYLGKSATEKIDTFIKEASIDIDLKNDFIIGILTELDLSPVLKEEDSNESSD